MFEITYNQNYKDIIKIEYKTKKNERVNLVLLYIYISTSKVHHVFCSHIFLTSVMFTHTIQDNFKLSSRL